MTKPILVVMAAGMGSRYGGLKQVEPVGPAGEMLVDYSIFDAIRAGFERAVFIIRRDIEDDFRRAVGRRFERHIDSDYAFQELEDLPAGFTPAPGRTKPWGTGQAILITERFVRSPFAVVNADDFYGLVAFQALFDYLQTDRTRSPHDYALVGYILRQTLSAHGTVSRGICDLDGDRLRNIREIKRIDRANGTPFFKDEGGTVQRLDPDATVSMNTWGFTTEIFEQLRELFTEFLARHASSPDAEFLIPSAVGTLLERNEARVSVLPSAAQWFGITYQQDKAQAAARIADLIASGDYPPRLWS